MFDFITLSIFFKILLAAALGMIIGAEREHRHKTAGLRTYTLVALGSALFTVLSIYGFNKFATPSFDPGRIAGQIVVGIGFLGAGLIIFRENKVQGLTSAAGVWVTSAIGMAVGLGFYSVAVFVTILVFLVLSVLTAVEEIIEKRRING